MMSVTVHLPARAEDVARWERGETAVRAVKENRARTVWRVEAGEPALYVKRFPPSLFRDRAKKEARLLRELDRAGIPCPRLVATARDRAGAYVVTEEIEGAEVLKTLLAGGGPGTRGLLDRLARLTRRLHDAGFDHGDLHVGNVLARGGELYVIDVHRARRVRSLSARRRIEAAAFVAMSFRDLVPLTEIARFFRAYGLASKADLLRAFASLRAQFDLHWRSRQERCTKEGTGFVVGDGVYFRRGVDRDALIAAAGAGGPVVKQKDGESLERLEGGLFLKRTRHARALKIWRNAHAIAVRGIRTPRLDACGHGWVAGEWVDEPDLHTFVPSRYGALARGERIDFLFRLARFVRRMHDRGIFHRDLKATNVLAGAREFAVIDVDRVRFPREVSDRDRMFNLAQLNAAVTPPVTKTDRLRLLGFYFGRDRERWKRRRAWIAEIMRITVARRHFWP